MYIIYYLCNFISFLYLCMYLFFLIINKNLINIILRFIMDSSRILQVWSENHELTRNWQKASIKQGSCNWEELIFIKAQRAPLFFSLFFVTIHINETGINVLLAFLSLTFSLFLTCAQDAAQLGLTRFCLSIFSTIHPLSLWKCSWGDQLFSPATCVRQYTT